MVASEVDSRPGKEGASARQQNTQTCPQCRNSPGWPSFSDRVGGSSYCTTSSSENSSNVFKMCVPPI